MWSFLNESLPRFQGFRLPFRGTSTTAPSPLHIALPAPCATRRRQRAHHFHSVQIIVADTGNNRLQVFHVEELGPIPDWRPGLVSKGNRGLPGALDAEPSGSYEDIESLDSWSRYHLAIAADVASVRHEQEAGKCMETGRRLRNGRGEEGASCRDQDTERGDELLHQESKTCCLLVVDGCEEHSGHAPRIHQPCDVAFWRPKSYSCGVQPSSAGSSTLTPVTPFDCTTHGTWVPDIPPWYHYASSQDEEALREQLLSLASPQSGCSSTAISPDLMTSASTSQGTKDRGQGVEGVGSCRTNDGHQPEFREPEAGAFVVCETGVRGTLRLLVLEKQEVNFKVALRNECRASLTEGNNLRSATYIRMQHQSLHANASNQRVSSMRIVCCNCRRGESRVR